MKICKLKLLILYILIFVSNCTYSQKYFITGCVKDSLTSQFLINANVSLTDLKTSYTTQAITNSEGVFKLENISKGNYELVIKFIGYNTLTQNIIVDNKNILMLDTKLLKQETQLKAVTVVSAKNKAFINFSGNKIILNVSQSPIASGGNVLDVISRAPGILLQNDNITFRNKKTLILIDGKPSNLSGNDLQEMLASISANTIDKIEILPSPSAKYDAQGGSIINIILNKINYEGINGNFNVGIGIGKNLKNNVGFNINYKKSNINLGLAFNYFYNPQYYDNNSIRFIDASLKIHQSEYETRTRNNNALKLSFDYNITKNTVLGITVKGNTNLLNRSLAIVSNFQSQNQNIDTASNTGTNGNIVVHNPSINVYYKTKIDSVGRTITINTDLFDYQKKWDEQSATFYQKSNNPSILNLQNNTILKIKTYSFSIDFSEPIKNGKIDLGLKTMFSNNRNEANWLTFKNDVWVNDITKSNLFIYKENINACYFSLEKMFKDSWVITTGLRGEQTNTSGTLINDGSKINKNYFNIFPNIDIQYVKDPSHIISVKYRKEIERVGYNVVNSFLKYISQYNFSQGNPSIEPEIYHSVDFNYTLKQSLVLGINYINTRKLIAPIYKSGANNSIISTIDNLGASNLCYWYLNLNKAIGNVWTSNLTGGIGFLSIGTNEDSYKSNISTWGYLIQSNNIFQFNKGLNVELFCAYTGPTMLGIYRISGAFNSSVGISKLVLKNNATIKLSFSDIFNTQIQKSETRFLGININENRKAESQFLQCSFSYKFGNKNMVSKKNRQTKADDIIKRIAE
ncbi:MAG: outer membrane beta-barrel family protein [Limnohabitans sp.]|nr:outer membrane beta-barrel family protein [Limnohabitans sp.]